MTAYAFCPLCEQFRLVDHARHRFRRRGGPRSRPGAARSSPSPDATADQGHGRRGTGNGGGAAGLRPVLGARGGVHT